MNDYLAKPIEPRKLAAVLARWLDKPAGDAGLKSPPAGRRPAADGEAVFDEAEMLSRFMGDRMLAGQIISTVLRDVPLQLLRLKKMIEEADAPAVRRQAHALKGAAANVAACALRNVASAAEQAGKAGDLECAAALLPCLEERFAQLQVTLRESGWR